MSKKSRLRGPFNKQHGKRAKPLMKSASRRLYHIHLSLPSQLNWKKSLFFFTSQILGLPVNTLAANKKYRALKRENLMILIQIQLSQKHKTFSQFFTAFLKSR